MNIIKTNETIYISDRTILSVTNQSDAIDTISETSHCKFIMATHAKCNTDDFSISGCFAVTTRKKITLSKMDNTGKIVIIHATGFNGLDDKATILNNVNTPGHLSYIDGCSNSNIIDPPRNGDPCVNYLFIPKNTDQTFHTHPSVRIILILSGQGVCSLKDSEIPLIPGQVYNLPRHTIHRFKTTDDSLSVMVFHPDSDSGPKDEANPMKTRTLINN
jgi:mannose-6-phosphate isomerase-like protein (cupin superfamily)